MVLWLFAEPIPFTPCIGNGGVIGTIIGQVDGPHDTCVEIRSNGLILKSGEVRSGAEVAIHAGTECAIGFVITNDTIICYNGGRRAQEATSPISD